MPKTKKKETLVLLDMHAIIHRAYHALPEFTSPAGDPVGALYGVVTMLLKIVKDLDPDHVVATYDLPGPTHRHDVYKEYKGKRPKMDDALAVQIAKSRTILSAFGIPSYEAPGFEADDVIGTIAETAKKKFDVIIASGDMDTLQLVDDERVRVFTLRKGIQDTILYDEDAVVARYGFPPKAIPDYKGFAGDTSDNIIGIPGIGEKTATTLIKEFGSVEGVYTALKKSPTALEKAGIKKKAQELIRAHEDEALFSKVLATIRLDAPVKFIEPEKSLKEGYVADTAVELMTEWGFRSLVPRVRGLFTEGTQKNIESPLQTLTLQTDPDEGSATFKEAQVMLWLLHSDTTNPSTEDILGQTKSKTLQEAHKKLEERLDAEGLRRVYEEIEKPLIPVIEDINNTGVSIACEYLAELSKEYHKELALLSEKIYEAAGGVFNINSPRQLGEVVFVKLGLGQGAGKRQKKTSTGQISTKESELVKLKGEHPIIDYILAHRELSKLLSTYIDAIPPLLGEDGRLRTTFVQTGTTTGRMSSQSPNLQNIPIKSELGRRIRNAFIAPKGRTLLTFDYGQIELRLAAWLSGDETLSDIFRRGEDIHSGVASRVFNVPEKEVTYEMRRRAKVINFGILYGMGVNALKDSLGTDRAEAQEFYTRYFETFGALAEYLEKTRREATRKGYTETHFGRRRYFPGIKSKIPYIRAQAERMAINAPMQGTQSDIMKIAMVRLHDYFKKEAPEAMIVLQIHDELMFEVPEEGSAALGERIKTILEGIVSPDDMNGIPLVVAGAQGKNWGEMQKI